jgi:hypothetical protein
MKAIGLAGLLAVIALGAAGAQTAPRFADFPAGAVYRGKAAQPVLDTRDKREYRTRLREGMTDAKPNFAAKYVVVTWGCGTACVLGAYVDAATGRVTMLPFSLSGWREAFDGFKPVDTRADSRLVIFSGMRGEEGVNGRHYYVFENGRLKHLQSVDTDGDFTERPR